jgi:hypothetical protein
MINDDNFKMVCDYQTKQANQWLAFYYVRLKKAKTELEQNFCKFVIADAKARKKAYNFQDKENHETNYEEWLKFSQPNAFEEFIINSKAAE